MTTVHQPKIAEVFHYQASPSGIPTYAMLSPLEVAKSQNYSYFDRTIFETVAGNSSYELQTSNRDECDFLTILATCQSLNIDFLPITWQPALENLGVGGQAQIQQSLIDISTSFAFSRVKFDSFIGDPDETRLFRALWSQLQIAGNPQIRIHPNTISLIGICWDFRDNDRWEPSELTRADENVEAKLNKNSSNKGRAQYVQSQWKAWPVLVYLKTQLGDLHCFMQSSSGQRLDIHKRLDLCRDIARGLEVLHSNRVVHGDIKPHDILIFEEDEGNYIAKISDFGFSTQMKSDRDYARTPRSIPWDAPEWHHREHDFRALVKMDIYSFALLCLWLLFGEQCVQKGILLDSYQEGQYERLRLLKTDNQLTMMAVDLVYQNKDLSTGQARRLAWLFESCLTASVRTRERDIAKILRYLPDISGRSLDSTKLSQPYMSPESSIVSRKSFSISASAIEIYKADFRLRCFIAACLQRRFLTDRNERESDTQDHQNDVLQLAICYLLGLGVGQDHKMVEKILQRHEMLRQSLAQEVDKIKTGTSFVNWKFLYDLYDKGLALGFDFGNHYREQNITMAAKSKLQEEICWAVAILGGSSAVVRHLRMGLFHINYSENRWREAKELQIQIMTSSSEALGEEHSQTLSNKIELALVSYNLAEFDEAERVATEAFQAAIKVHGMEHRQTLDSMSTLALTLRHGQWIEFDSLNLKKDKARQIKDRWDRADKLEQQVMEIRLRTLGAEHLDTLLSMTNVMHVYTRRKRMVEAEEMCQQIIRSSTKMLGSNHPNTLTSKANLGAFYRDLERFDEAVILEKEVMEASLDLLGEEHPDTILSIAALGMTYLKWEHYEEAAGLQDWALRLRGSI